MTLPRWLALVLLLLPALHAQALRVSVVPTSATLEPGATESFGAAVAGTSNTTVRWRVNGVLGGNATAGTISANGLYTAPATPPAIGRVTVSVESVQDPGKSATARVWLVAPQPHLAITPQSVALPAEQTQQFDAELVNAPGVTLTWRVNGINGGNDEFGRISAGGLYTAPATAPRPATVIIGAVVRDLPAVVALARVELGPAATLYVATSGDDANDGSADAPLRTLQRAAVLAGPGDTIEVAGGVYNQRLDITHGGSLDGGDINFRAATGETAIIDGTGLSIPGGQHGLVTITTGFVSVSGFELRNYRSTTAAVPIGFYVRGAAHDAQLIGNRVHAIATTAAPGSANAFGILVAGDAATAVRNITVRGNEIDHTTTGNSETLSVNGNVTGWTIADNLVHDANNIGIDAIGFEGTAPAGAVDRAREGRILRNAVYNISSFGNPAYGADYAAGGIYVDGGMNIVISANAVHHADIGIELASEHAGKFTRDIVANNNLVWHSRSAGISIGGANATNGGVRNCTLANNTLFENDTEATGSGELQVQHFAGNNRFQNNIVQAGAQGLFVNGFTGDSADGLLADFNLYFGQGTGQDGLWVWAEQDYHGILAWRSGTGKDSASPFLDPQFADPVLSRLRPLAGSPAVGSGTPLGSGLRGTRDVAGLARLQGALDKGGYERP